MGVMKCFISKLHKVIALEVLLRVSNNTEEDTERMGM